MRHLKKETLINKLYLIPAIAILVLAMLALHASVDLLQDSEKILEHFLAHTAENEGEQAAQIIDIQHLKAEHTNFYISVLALGFLAFMLYLIAAHKMLAYRKLHKLLANRLAAIEAAADGIGIVDKNGNLSYMNKALMDIHGITPDQKTNFIGGPWVNLYSEKGRDTIIDHVLPTLHRDKSWKGKSPVVRQDGSIVMTELSLSELEDGSMIGTARDISERQKSEAQKKELEQQFYQAQKMEAIGRLAGGIAHDFNNVLAAINGYAEFLTEDLKEGTAQHGYAKNILQAGLQAHKVVDQILAFSRQKQSGKEVLNMLDPVNETLSMLTATLPKTIELKTELTAKQTTIEGNSTQIAQVIMNLCVNAVDAMDDAKEDHGTITLGLLNIAAEDIIPSNLLTPELLPASESPPIGIEDLEGRRTRLTLGVVAMKHKYVRLRVADSGSGMSRAVMEHIFEPFFTTKTVDKGTGLGLATVHGVISSHQGTLVVDSILGQGTTFDLYFPLSSHSENVAEKSTIQSIVPKKAQGNILVVEDQENVRDMLTQMLERMGYNAHATESGLDALTLLREQPGHFDLVVTDHNMPKMTGLELVQQAHLSFPDLPFILVSGYSLERLQDLMKEHPAIKTTLRKPVSKEQLSEKVADILMAKKKAA